MLRSLTLFQLWTYLRAASIRALHVLVILALTLPNLAGSVEARKPAAAESTATGNDISARHMDRRPVAQAATGQETAGQLTTLDLAQVTADVQYAPVMFVENVGQFDDSAKFAVRGEQGSIFLAPDAIWVTLAEPVQSSNAAGANPLTGQTPEATPTPESPLAQTLHGVNLRLTLSGANPNARIEGFDPLDTTVSYFIGSDPGQWRPDVPVYAGVRYVDIYPGVNLEITSENGRWAWRLVAQRADALALEALAAQAAGNENGGAGINLQVEGADALTNDGSRVHITTGVGEFSLPLLDAVSADGQPLELSVGNEMVTEVAPTTSATATPTSTLTATATDTSTATPTASPMDTPAPEPSATPTETVTPEATPSTEATCCVSTETPTEIPTATTSGYGGTGVLAMPAIKPEGAPATDDPADLLYSTFLGTEYLDYAFEIAVDGSGATYVTGYSHGPDFPHTPGVYDTDNTNVDAFVTKINAAGSKLVYSTFLGGSSWDNGASLALGNDGAAYVAGTTGSTDFPTTTGAYRSWFSGGDSDTFVAKLNATGTVLQYGTYIGGSAHEVVFGISVDQPTASAYIVGVTDSPDFPLQAAHDPTFVNGEGFVARLNSVGGLVYSTYMGGSMADGMDDIAVDPSGDGSAYVVGATQSSDFPIKDGSYDTSFNGDWDIVVAKFTAAGSVVYSTFIGGGGPDCEKGGPDKECAIAVGADGSAYITGITASTNFPVLNAYDPTYSGYADAFVVRLRPDGTDRIFATYLGGSGNELGYDASYNNVHPDIAVDLAGSGAIFVVGNTNSTTDFPIEGNGYQQTGQGGYDAYVARFTPSGALTYTTHLGGGGNDSAFSVAVALDGTGAAFVAGHTLSSGFPISAAPYDGVYSGDTYGDAFLTKLRAGGTATAPELPPSQAFATNECPFCNNAIKVSIAGQGVNTWSGNYNHQHGDGQVVGTGATLSFERSYNSLASGADPAYLTYNDVLGYGWTHNYNVRLIFPGDPGGETGMVKLIAPRGSVLRFTDNGDGTYTPYPAVLAELTRTDLGGGNYEYHIVTNSQYEYIFDNGGKLQRIYDPQDHFTTLVYTGGQLTRIQDETNSRWFELAYSGGRLTTVTDNANRTATYTFTNDDLTSVTDMEGRTWQYQYNGPASHLLTKVIDPSLKTLAETFYDGYGRATQQKDGDGNQITQVLNYGDPATREVRIDSDDPNVKVIVTFDNNVPVSVDGPGDADSQTAFVGQGINPGTITDPNDNVTTLTWSANGGNLTGVLDALDNSTSLSYDSLNNLTQVIDAHNHITRYIYNGALLVNSIANYKDGVYDSNFPTEDLITLYEYTASPGDDPQPPNLIKKVTDPRGIQTFYTYTAQGQRASVIVNYEDGVYEASEPDKDLITSYTYTTAADAPQPLDRLKTVADPLGGVTLNTYDAAGNLIQVTRNYLNGQPQNYQNTYNLITQYQYDAAGRVVKVTDTLSRADWTCYDSAGRVARAVQNATGDGSPASEDPCDAANYVPSADPAYDRITTTTYDGDGNVIATTGPDGVITRTYYDELNRPTMAVQNWVWDGHLITDPNPPAYDSNFPDRNIRATTVYDPAGNVVQSIDNAGRITYTCYDELNRAVKTVQNPSILPPAGDPCANPSPSGAADVDVITQMIYDEVGNVIATIDPSAPNGNITRTYYDPLNRPYVVMRNWYVQGGNIADPTIPTYNSQFPDRNIGTQTFYDEAGRAYKTLDLAWAGASPAPTTWTCYDDAGRVTRTVLNATAADPCAPGLTHTGAMDENLITEYRYDTAGRQIAVIAPDGVITRTYYDDADRRTAVTANLVYRIGGVPQPPADAIALTTPPTYDVNYPDENVTTRYTYDALGRVVTITDNADLVSHLCYDALGRTVKTIQNPTVSDPCSTYTPGSNPDEDVIGQTTYDTKGDVIAATDPEGKIARTYYDALHRARYVVTNLFGQSVDVTTPPAYTAPDQNMRQEMKYDAAGRGFEVVDNTAMVTRTNYDLLDRGIAVIVNYVDGPGDNQTNLTAQTTYNKRGDVTDREDANDAITHFEYDAMGRLTAVVENYQPGVNPTVDINVRTEYTYDSHGNRLTITNAKLQTTNFQYDALDRLLTEGDPLGHTTTHTYSLSGAPATLLDANSETTTYAYDDLRRLTTIDYPAGTNDVAFTYDAAGNRTTMTDPSNTTWTLDGLFRPTQIAAVFGSVGYTYDLLGLRQSLTYPDTKSVNYAYDGLNRLTGVTPVGSGQWAAGSTNYTYNNFGALATETRPNGVTTTYAYDDAHRLTGIQHSAFHIHLHPRQGGQPHAGCRIHESPAQQPGRRAGRAGAG